VPTTTDRLPWSKVDRGNPLQTPSVLRCPAAVQRNLCQTATRRHRSIKGLIGNDKARAGQSTGWAQQIDMSRILDKHLSGVIGR